MAPLYRPKSILTSVNTVLMLSEAVGHWSSDVNTSELPIAIIGAGPVGLAAATQAVSRGSTADVFEAGTTVGASVLRWGHVRIFSPWKYDIDAAARALLEAEGWNAPDGDEYPTGRELVERDLRPLSP